MSESGIHNVPCLNMRKPTRQHVNLVVLVLDTEDETASFVARHSRGFARDFPGFASSAHAHPNRPSFYSYVHIYNVPVRY